jgi:hypothetical protein
VDKLVNYSYNTGKIFILVKLYFQLVSRQLRFGYLGIFCLQTENKKKKSFHFQYLVKLTNLALVQTLKWHI